MKFALIIPDGCADEPQPSLGGRTPLEAADVPHMDAIVRQGIIGRTDNIPTSMPSGSDVGTMCLFGYDPLAHHSGRAPLEAAAQGIELGPDDWAIRCNLVTVRDGKMVSFTAEQISSELGRQLIELIGRDQSTNSQWEFFPGVSYRNLVLYCSGGEPAPFGPETSTIPPHDITDQPVAEHLPTGPGAELLRELMDRSVELFATSAENQARQDRGEFPATGIWLWGLGKRPNMEPFAKRFGKTGAVITAVDLLRGIGRLVGWRVVEVPGATGYIDTDYAAKGRYAIETLPEVDLVVVHVEAPDEASHEGDAEAKVRTLEQIDREIVGPVHECLRRQGDYRILVSPDHPTFVRTKTHSYGYCPFAMCGTGVAADTAGTYDEPTAEKSEIEFPHGHELMPMFLGC